MSKTIADYTRSVFVKERPKDKPNIVFLMADQQRHDTIAALGANWMKTPNLDRLVNEGCAFTNACTCNPICVPARASLITGLYGRHTGITNMNGTPIDPTIPRLPELLARSGYHCEAIGKMHFGPPRQHHGFHRLQLMEETPHYVQDDDYTMWLRQSGYAHVQNIHGIRNLFYHQPQRALVPEEATGCAWVGNRSVEFIHLNHNRPFFLFASWIAPHPPFNSPDSFADLYQDADLPQATPWESAPNPRLKHHQKGFILEGFQNNPAKLRRMRELYYAQISLVDKYLGKVLKALEDVGQLDNTIICFFSDHGEMLGDNGAFEKNLPNDPSIRIPLIVRYPKRVKPGSKRHDFADLLDLFPTALDAAGVELPKEIPYPGESLLVPAEASIRDRSCVFVENRERHERFLTLRGPRYKLNYWFHGPREELYDLQTDPAEVHNLLHGELTADQKEVYEEMKAKLTAAEARWGLPGNVKDGVLVPWTGPLPPPWPPEEKAANLIWQFHAFPHQMPPEWRAHLESDRDSVRRAIAPEPTVKLSDLDLDFYESAGGDKNLLREVREKGQ